MSEYVCPNCGHHQPTKYGPGVYCENCGEPKEQHAPAWRDRNVSTGRFVEAKKTGGSFEGVRREK